MDTAADRSPDTSTAPDKPARILVVDDTPLNIRLLEAILIPRGYTVLQAASGQDALDVCARERPDLVLLDILMPGMPSPRSRSSYWP